MNPDTNKADLRSAGFYVTRLEASPDWPYARTTIVRGPYEHSSETSPLASEEHCKYWDGDKWAKLVSCDACGALVPRDDLTFSVSYGIDTWACEECHDE